ncbi:MAG: hypothetical protein DSY42_00705 [Aquifex sp.]|nr:MAG: hypothetical protein DSY42_00705 [Aquifex sp.]
MGMVVNVKRIENTDKTKNGNLILALLCEDCEGNLFRINLILRNDEEKHFMAKQLNLLKAGEIDQLKLKVKLMRETPFVLDMTDKLLAEDMGIDLSTVFSLNGGE